MAYPLTTPSDNGCAELRDRGHRVSREMVAKLMKLNGIHPDRRKRRVPVTTDSRHEFAIASNLLRRNFKIMVPDTVWLADISYIPTGEGWLHLAAVKGEPLKAPLAQAQWRTATMEIVGWSMSERLKSSPCEDALKLAIRNRRPPPGLIVHTDRGVQYACDIYRKLLRLHRITASLSRKCN